MATKQKGPQKKASTKKASTKKSLSKAPAKAPVEPGAYNPLATLRDEIDRVFDRFFGGSWPTPWRPFEWEPFKSIGSLGLPPLGLSPSVDMSETDKQYELTVELPGMDEKDIELVVTDTTITLKGEKKAEKETKEKDYHLTERSWGSLHRSFSLPAGVEANKIKASFAKGILTVTLPKTKEAQVTPRKIDVTSG